MAGRLLDPQGRLLVSFRSSHTITELEQFREFRILDDGSVVQMAFTGQGVLFLLWRAP